MQPERVPVVRGHCPTCGAQHSLDAGEGTVAAVEELMAVLSDDPRFGREGKMFGVLVGRDRSGSSVRLCAFSGRLDGRLWAEGFVGPTRPRSAADAREAATLRELTALSAQIHAIDVAAARRALDGSRTRIDREIAAALERRRRGKIARAIERRALLDAGRPGDPRLAELDAISQREGGRIRALRRQRRSLLAPLERELLARIDRRARLRAIRRARSRQLQSALHAAHGLVNFAGRHLHLEDLFGAKTGIPTGAGECCAPKLLQEAALRGIRPTGLAEFWWGPSPPDGRRAHRRLYPPCTEKCGPLLGHLLCGFERPQRPIEVLYEDTDIVAIDKPPGLLSVTGRGRAGADCVETRLALLRPTLPFLRAVHRLDQATSGVLVLAKSPAAFAALGRAFAAGAVHKEYRARVAGHVGADAGEVRLPLRPALRQRPRQIVDRVGGRPATTAFRVLTRSGGTSDLVLFPRTGRTHQIRVHCAHGEGLATPIVGDTLYGPDGPAPRLLLHAHALRLPHPRTGQTVEILAPLPAELAADQ